MLVARDMVSCGNNSRLGADPRLLLGCSGYCAQVLRTDSFDDLDLLITNFIRDAEIYIS
jgi:hypothetical protein